MNRLLNRVFTRVVKFVLENGTFTGHVGLAFEKKIELAYREDICLQTLLLLFKYANHKNKRSFVSTANEALVCTLMTIGDY